LSDDDESLGGCPGPAALEVFANGGNGGNGTMHCPAGYEHCLTHHCRARYGKFKVSVSCKNGGNVHSFVGVDKTLKNCARYVGGATTGEESCNFIRDKEFCGDDPKYYCRYCDTDLCNNEDE
jgi:hypothetical protein